jgi:hypothetical protein
MPSKMAVETYMVSPPSDWPSLQLMRRTHPEYKWMLVYWHNPYYAKEILVDMNGVEYPIDPEPAEIANNNLILIGGTYPNAYSYKYFKDIITYDPDKGIMTGPGVYANGKRCITSVTRPNGTIVTGVWGVDATDTFYATQDYLGGGNILLTILPIGIAFVAGLVAGGLVGRRL